MSVRVVRPESALPSNLDAEEALLSAILLQPSCLNEVISPPVSLHEQHFFSEANARLYAALKTMHDQGRPIDLVTLADWLTSHHQLEGVGGYPRLASLFDRVADPGHVQSYGEIIKDKAVLRQLRSFGRQLMERASDDQSSLTDLLDDASRQFNAIVQVRHDSSSVNVRDLLAPIIRELQDRQNQTDPFTGTRTGFTNLDHLTLGLQRSDLIILAARPSVGKTAMALNIAFNAAHNGSRVAIFSLEMSAKQLAYRLVSIAGMVDSMELKRGTVGVRELLNATNRLQRCDITIFDTPALTPLELRAQLRMLQRQGEQPLDLVIVDYLQLMQGPSLKRSDNRAQEISEISRTLKGIAREINVPVLALSQLSRAIESRPDKRPQLSDLRESGSIEQDADIVMFLWRKDQAPGGPAAPGAGYAPPRANLDDMRAEAEISLVVAKHRNGQTRDIEMRFQKRYTTFGEVVAGAGRDIYFEGG